MGSGDGKATAAGSVQTNSVTNHDFGNGVLSAYYRYVTDSFGVWSAKFNGAYYVPSTATDEYSLLAGQANASWQSNGGLLGARGGIIYGVNSDWERFAGGELRVGNADISGKVYGGRRLSILWDGGLPSQELDENWIYGGVLAAGLLNTNALVGLEREVRPDGGTEENRLSYRIFSDPSFAGGWFSPYSSGSFMLVADGREVEAGFESTVIKNRLSTNLFYKNSNLPPFYPFIKDMPRDTDNILGAAANVVVADGLVFFVSGEHGERSDGGSLGVSLPYFNAETLYHRDHDGSNAYGASANGTIPIVGDILSGRPYASVVYDESGGVSQLENGMTADAGGRLMWQAASWLGVSLAGGYQNGPIAGGGEYALLNIVVGDSATDAGGSSYQPISQGFARFRHSQIVRRFGELMKSIAAGFSHLYHLTDADVAAANNNQPLGCHDCHSPDPLIRVAPEKVKEVCSGCHDVSDKLKELATVEHPGSVTGYSCQTCHTDMARQEAPTGSVRQDEVLASGSCVSCHDGLDVKPSVTQKYHPDGYFPSHKIKGKFAGRGCSTSGCHTDVGAAPSCAPCHADSVPKDFHAGSGHMKLKGGDMKHGTEALKSHGASCTACHPAGDKTCKACH